VTHDICMEEHNSWLKSGWRFCPSCGKSVLHIKPTEKKRTELPEKIQNVDKNCQSQLPLVYINKLIDYLKEREER
jgi:uncharacterized Zn finger protein (UPF0148 family)